MRRWGMMLLAVGLVLGLGCASKKLTLHPVISNVYDVEGFPVVTVSDDYELVECRNYDQGGLNFADCYFLNKDAGPHGGSIYLMASTAFDTRDAFYFDASLKHDKRTIEFKGHTFILSGESVDSTHNKYDNPGSQETVRQERLELVEIFDSDRARNLRLSVDMDVLPQEPRDEAATLELLLELFDQAIVSIEP